VASQLPARSEVDRRFTWNAESVFADDAEWEQAVETILSKLPDLAEFKGHLGDSPDALADWFDASERVHRLMGKVMVYSTMAYSVDVGEQSAAARTDRARSVAAQLGAATSFALPEMITIGIPKLREWVDVSPRLSHVGHYFDRLDKLQGRIRSAEVEELLTQVSDPLATALAVHGVLANADLKFAPALGEDGEIHEVAQGTIGTLLTNPDREVRRSAFDSYADAHLEMQHAMAASLAGGVKRDVFFARARGYSSSLQAALEPSHIPIDVYHNVVQTFRDNVSTWHRYWRVRRKALGLDVLKPYDTRAQLGATTLPVP
jgi:oligoendopeptidase F